MMSRASSKLPLIDLAARSRRVLPRIEPDGQARVLDAISAMGGEKGA
jgi:hypothetical protein